MDPFYIHDWNINPEVIFQLKDLTETDAFAVWDNPQRKFLRSGNLNGTDNISRDITEIRFLKNVDFRNIYPNCSRQFRIRRNILVADKQYTFELARTANEQLKQAVETLQNMNKNPLDYQFKLGRTGTGLQTKYTLGVAGEVTSSQDTTPSQDTTTQVAATAPAPEQPEAVASTIIPEQTPQVTVPAKEEEPVIAKEEQEFVDSIKKENIKNLDRNYFDQICRANGKTDTKVIDKLWGIYQKP